MTAIAVAQGVRLRWPEERFSRLPAQELEVFYDFRAYRDVAFFLAEHPFLVPLLYKLPFYVQLHFDRSIAIALEVVADPELPDGNDELVAWLRTSLSPKEALARLHAFDDDWRRIAPVRVRCVLCVHVEYV